MHLMRKMVCYLFVTYVVTYLLPICYLALDEHREDGLAQKTLHPGKHCKASPARSVALYTDGAHKDLPVNRNSPPQDLPMYKNCERL